MFGLFNKKKAKEPAKKSREELIAEAKENAAAAREQIGDETLDKIAAAMEKKENSEFNRMKAEIKEIDSGKVADNLKYMIDEEKK